MTRTARSIAVNRQRLATPARADIKPEGKTMNRLLRLFAENTARPRGYRVVRAADDKPAEIWLYDPIGGWDGILAKDFVKDLAAVDAAKITLRINSPGGDVFDARAIVAALRDHPAEITARIDGLAASAASYVALAADRVQMVAGSFLMIHNAWALVMGDKNDMAEMGGLLDKVDQSIIDDYAKATGQSREQLQTWMTAETWFTAEEAVQHKFAAEIVGGAEEKPAAAQAAWNLSAYENTPQALRNAAPGKPADTLTQQIEASARNRARRLSLLERVG